MDKLEQVKNFAENFTNTEKNLSQTERVVSGAAGGGLIAYGLKRRDATGAVLAFVGGLLGLRAATGYCQVKDALGTENLRSSVQSKLSSKVAVKKQVTINKSQTELFGFWRNFENLPQFMNHLESVKNIDATDSHWVAKAPLGYTVEWDAEIIDEIFNEKISWRTKDGADIPSSGFVEFNPTTERGTEVVVHLWYEAPAGKLGALAAKIFGEEPSQQVEEDLRRLKSLMETGVIMKTEGQPSGRTESKSKTKKASA